jgi:autotransporter-associated beta strand protein
LTFATGGNAQLNTDAGGEVHFEFSAGPFGDGRLTAGSIAGAGTYHLGADQLTVLSGSVSGLIDGAGGSLVKVGPGTLTLSGAHNTYSGGTTIEQGAFEVAAIGAAGTGPITFANTGKAKVTLDIDNAALSGHVFASNPIDNFGKHDYLDLTGLHFHAGATATYHKASHHLTVHSGTVADTLTLLSPHGTHFATASDHHGGTDVFLVVA